MVNTHVAEIADTVEVATDYRRHRCRGTIRVMRMLLIQLAMYGIIPAFFKAKFDTNETLLTRITKQRMMLLDIILEEDCSCCKEIYYKASKIDPKIGTATVYRMINTLEEIGAISRKNMYKVHCTESCEENGDTFSVEFDDNSVINLPAKKWNQIIEKGLAACGYIDNQTVKSVTTIPFCS